MAYDEDLAARVRELTAPEPHLDERRMFGGLAMLISGNLAVVVRSRGGLMVRVDHADFDRLCAEPGAEAAEMRGRPMRGWVTVSAAAVEPDAALARWVRLGVAFARTLPPK